MKQKKENSSAFIKRLFGFSIGPIINAFIGFVSVPITTWFLFPEELGKAAMYNTAVMIISSVIFLGLTNSLSREYKSVKDKSKLLLNSIIAPLLLALFFSLIAILFRKKISLILFNEDTLLPIILFSIVLPIKVLESFASSIIRMEEKAKLFSLHQVLAKATNFTILVLVFVFIKKSYHAVLLASVISISIVAVSQIIFMRKIWIGIFYSKVDISQFKSLLKFGLPFVPATALAWLFNSFDKIALREFADFNEIGIYSGAFKVIALLNIIKTSFSSFWNPTSYRWFNNNESITKYQKVSDTLMSIFISFSALAIFSRNLLFLLLSDKYLPSASIFPFLMFIPILHTVSTTTSMGIQFMRKTHYQIYTFLIASITNVCGNLLLVPKYGAIGAGISTGFSYIVFFNIRSYFSGKLWQKIKLKRHTINIILLSCLCSLTLLPNQVILVESIVVAIIISFNIKNNMYIIKTLLKTLTSKNK